PRRARRRRAVLDPVAGLGGAQTAHPLRVARAAGPTGRRAHHRGRHVGGAPFRRRRGARPPPAPPPPPAARGPPPPPPSPAARRPAPAGAGRLAGVARSAAATARRESEQRGRQSDEWNMLPRSDHALAPFF